MLLKRIVYPWVMILVIISIITACNANRQTTTEKTRVYQSETGKMTLPEKPKRVAVLFAPYTGNLLKLGITPIAITDLPKKSKFFAGKLDKAEVIGEDSVEKLLSLRPDLIITHSDDRNIKKYQEIAPTVVMTYTKYNYLEQHIELGKIVGKEDEARAWVEEWKKKVATERKKVHDAIGSNATAMVLESYHKELYLYGKNWGRGTEVIYQALALKAPPKIEKDVFGNGYKAISSEAIPEYAGDFIFLGEGSETDNSFVNTDVWKNIPAVKKDRVITFDSDSFYFNDPISLEKELAYIVEELVKRK